jgi:ubiquinone/menaquinone biosynthesis C-methylase UbiE
MTPQQANEVLQEWSESARFWAKHAETIREMFAPLTAALIEEAAIGPGQRVLDVAGGAGEPSLTIAKVVGPTGFVTCTDAIAGMVQTAEARARAEDLTNIKFHQCPAEALPFESDSFDAAVSRLGIMFFPDPLAGLQEMLRVVRAEGVMSLAVWARSDVNPFSYKVTEVVSRYVPAAPTQPTTHDAFRFAEPGKLANLLKQAGANKVRERILAFHIAAPISPEEFWSVRSETSGTLREKLATLSQEQRNQLRQAVIQNVREFFSNNQMNFPAQMLIVTGSKPGRGSPPSLK